MATAVLEEIAAGTRVCCSSCQQEFTTELPAALVVMVPKNQELRSIAAGCAAPASTVRIPWKPLPAHSAELFPTRGSKPFSSASDLAR